MVTLYNLSDLARTHGVTLRILRYHVAAGTLPPPWIKVGRRLHYTPAESRQIGDWLANREPARRVYSQAEALAMGRLHAGGMSHGEIAGRFGLSRSGVSKLIRRWCR